MNKNFFDKIRVRHSSEIYFLQQKNKQDFGNNVWKTKEWENSIKNNIFEGNVFILEEKITGFCFFKKIDNYIEIYSLFVDPRYRKRGVAKFLMKICIDFCIKNDLKKIILDVNEKNFQAIEFYKKIGFIFCGKRKDYYKDNENFYDSFTMYKIVWFTKV